MLGRILKGTRRLRILLPAAPVYSVVTPILNAYPPSFLSNETPFDNTCTTADETLAAAAQRRCSLMHPTSNSTKRDIVAITGRL